MTEKRNEYNQNKMKSKKRVVLIGAGEMGKSAPVISEEDYLIALDGGLLYCVEHGLTPDRIMGDFDSLPKEKTALLEKYPREKIYRLPCEKDDTDTLAAIKAAVRMGFQEFVIYGGLGGRLSHTIANVQSLCYLKECGLHGELVGENSRIFLIREENVYFDADEAIGYLSIFSYSERSEGVTLKNLKYELEDAVLTNTFPVGVSNEFIGKRAEVSVKNGTLLVVTERR